MKISYNVARRAALAELLVNFQLISVIPYGTSRYKSLITNDTDYRPMTICKFLSVAARGCLPPGANVCVAAPANQISSAVRVFFRISDIGV